VLIKLSVYLAVDGYCCFVWLGFFQVGEVSDKYTAILVRLLICCIPLLFYCLFNVSTVNLHCKTSSVLSFSIMSLCTHDGFYF